MALKKKSHSCHVIGILEGGRVLRSLSATILNSKVPGHICLYFFYGYFHVAVFGMRVINSYENSNGFSSLAMFLFSGTL